MNAIAICSTYEPLKFRHPRESRDPLAFDSAFKTLFNSKWIPAYAGMTVVRRVSLCVLCVLCGESFFKLNKVFIGVHLRSSAVKIGF